MAVSGPPLHPSSLQPSWRAGPPRAPSPRVSAAHIQDSPSEETPGTPPSLGTLEEMGELPAGRGDKGWLSGEGMAFDSQRALLTAVHSSLGQLWACRGREWEGRKVGLRRSGAAGKSPWVQATWKLHRFGPKQTVMGQDPARSPSFWWLRSGPHPHPQGVTKVRGGLQGPRWEDPLWPGPFSADA